MTERDDCPSIGATIAMPRPFDPDSLVTAQIVAIGDEIMHITVRQTARIEQLEAALKPFADMATAVGQNMPAKDDRWALVRVRDQAITHADLKRARDALEATDAAS